MPRVIEGETLFTQAEFDLKIEREYVPKSEVKENYVPKKAMQDRLEQQGRKLEASQGEIKDLRAEVKTLMQGQPDTEGLQSRIAELENEKHAMQDATVYGDLGLLGEDGAVDPKRERWFKYAWQEHVDGLPEDQKPADPRAAYRDWVKSEEGALADSFLKGLVKTPPTAAPPAAAGPAAADPPGTTPPALGAPPAPPTQPPAQHGKLTAQQLHDATLGNKQWMTEHRAATPEQRAQRMADLQVQAGTATA